MLLHACSATPLPGDRALCRLRQISIEWKPALRAGLDELETLSTQPSAALRLAAELPPPSTRNFFSAKAYLPSSTYWREVSTRNVRARVNRFQQERRELLREALCSPTTADTSELRGLMGMAVGGPAKLLVYASESAVRLASLGMRQLADKQVGFPYAAGVARCRRLGGFVCFFKPSLCDEQPNPMLRSNRNARDGVPRRTFDAELAWPQSLRRAMQLALALEVRLEHLHPDVEGTVQRLLGHVMRMDRSGATYNWTASRPRPATLGPSIGMHVRRGDACETLATPVVHGVTDLDAERRCYSLDEYLLAALDMKRLYGASHIILITDSEEVLRQLKRHDSARNFTWEWLTMKRRRIAGSEAQNLHVSPELRVLIEHRARRGDSANELIVSSLLAELRLIAQADIIVGTSRSFVTHAATLLVWARSGILPPIVSLEGDPIYTLLHVRGRFWKRAGDDHGWFSCVYARTRTPAECFSRLNLTTGSAVCMQQSFASAVLKLRHRRAGQRAHCLEAAHPVLD